MNFSETRREKGISREFVQTWTTGTRSWVYRECKRIRKLCNFSNSCIQDFRGCFRCRLDGRGCFRCRLDNIEDRHLEVAAPPLYAACTACTAQSSSSSSSHHRYVWQTKNFTDDKGDTFIVVVTIIHPAWHHPHPAHASGILVQQFLIDVPRSEISYRGLDNCGRQLHVVQTPSYPHNMPRSEFGS